MKRHYPQDSLGRLALCGRPFGRPVRLVESIKKAYESPLNREGMCSVCRRLLESREAAK